MMKKDEILKTYKDCIIPTYKRNDVIFVKGKGSKLVDIHGKEYLDFFPGWGVSNLGHCHSSVVAAVRDQIGKLIHIPNNYYTIPQAKLAKELVYWSFPGKVFFCNSGAEANEAAIKFARAYGKGKRYEIITFLNSFHGRTLGALSATGQERYQKPFMPLVPGFKSVEFNNIDAVRATVTDKTVAIMLELVQGEGGVNIADKDFVDALRKFCSGKDILLIIDEVQTGFGRTGKMFCYQNYDIKPDIIVLAKSIAGGLPMGAIVAKKEIADTLTFGMHASTFGGSPLVSKAALGVFKAIQKEKLLSNAQKMGELLVSELKNLKSKYSVIKEVRNIGLMIGIELKVEAESVFKGCLEKGLLINCTHNTVLRLMPALNITRKQIKKAIFILDKVLGEIT